MTDFDKCCMTHYPASTLVQVAEPVEQINDDIRRLVDKMTDIMIENKGIGLAAPQAGVSLQVFIVSIDGTRENVKAYINPTIEPDGGLEASEEGCLSLPGLSTKIKRYKQCSISATDLDGNEFTEQAEGLLARAFQHEFDHLQGRLIVHRMGQVAKIAARRKLKDLEKNHKQSSIS